MRVPCRMHWYMYIRLSLVCAVVVSLLTLTAAETE